MRDTNVFEDFINCSQFKVVNPQYLNPDGNMFNECAKGIIDAAYRLLGTEWYPTTGIQESILTINELGLIERILTCNCFLLDDGTINISLQSRSLYGPIYEVSLHLHHMQRKPTIIEGGLQPPTFRVYREDRDPDDISLCIKFEDQTILIYYSSVSQVVEVFPNTLDINRLKQLIRDAFYYTVLVLGNDDDSLERIHMF